MGWERAGAPRVSASVIAIDQPTQKLAQSLQLSLAKTIGEAILDSGAMGRAQPAKQPLPARRETRLDVPGIRLTSLARRRVRHAGVDRRGARARSGSGRPPLRDRTSAGDRGERRRAGRERRSHRGRHRGVGAAPRRAPRPTASGRGGSSSTPRARLRSEARMRSRDLSLSLCPQHQYRHLIVCASI